VFSWFIILPGCIFLGLFPRIFILTFVSDPGFCSCLHKDSYNAMTRLILWSLILLLLAGDEFCKYYFREGKRGWKYRSKKDFGLPEDWRISQWAISPKEERIFDNMALYLECRINKNALLQTVLLAILPTGGVAQPLQRLRPSYLDFLNKTNIICRLV